LLDEIQNEVNGQPEPLIACSEKAIRRLPLDSLMVGAGDSYIAAQCAAFLSSFKCRALDPYVLLSDPELSRGRTVAFISVSGRTQSNVAAARSVKRIAKRTLAVTANPVSPLAECAGETLLIPYPYQPRVPGTLSFTLSLVTALKLASVECKCDFPRLFAQAKSAAGSLCFSKNRLTLFLGNHAAYTVALYAAAKTFEFFGTPAQAELLEEFSHMVLFSLGTRDTVNVFQSADPSKIGNKLVAALGNNGYSASLLTSHGKNRVEEAFYFVFLTQLAVINRMRELGLCRPRFLDSAGRLGVSDAMIY
jgi:fructoselysine-6-P-deglycase FrlB-like protein